MARNACFLLLFSIGYFANSQQRSSEFTSKKIKILKDTTLFDSVPINPQNFRVFSGHKKILDTTEYQILYKNAILIINSKKYREIILEYFRYPSFITKVYSLFDKRYIVPDYNGKDQRYRLRARKKTRELTLLDGLKTSGFINRGIASGNNQSTVANSSMNLNVEGKLSENVSIKAHIFDTNIPLQNNGYSQSITDFDRIFMEIYSKEWLVKAGDLRLQNDKSYFLTFEKQAAGVEVAAKLTDKSTLSVSGAVVRGQFGAHNFVGIEGNQGPYKIFGPNNEPNFVVIAGSEKVFVNGSQIARGADHAYVIDYSIGEIQFNTTFPVTNDMRVRVEFQFSNRNYTRFVSYEKATYKTEDLEVSGYFYNENDVKNQPIQLNLTENQRQILSEAGNDLSLMVGESASPHQFDEAKILYKKSRIGSEEIFEYSTDENEELFLVTFSKVGENQGDYSIGQTYANGNVFVYVGANLGNYHPIVRFNAPTKMQLAVLNTSYSPSEKTQFASEIALSNHDQNLFSNIDNNQNKGVAAKLHWEQLLIDTRWKLNSQIDYLFVHENFSTIQRFQAVEFNRDWNLVDPTGNQQQVGIDLNLNNNTYKLNYSFQQLKFSEAYRGEKHSLHTEGRFGKTSFFARSSFLSNDSKKQNNTFLRTKAWVERSFSNTLWMGGFLELEANDGKIKSTQEAIATNHRFKEYEGYLGIGDSTRTFAKLGFNYRKNDSIRSAVLTKINHRKTYYLDTKIIQAKSSNLSLYANYRETVHAFSANENSLNSKIQYHQRLFKNGVTIGSAYETFSGNVAQQDFIYVEVAPSQGFYTWIDYNDNGIQEFDEFEISEFQDQANFLRVPLPNLRFIATQSAKIKQSVTINASQWRTKKGLKKVLSHFYNQLFLSSLNEQKRSHRSFVLNPFNNQREFPIRNRFSIKNNLYYNKGLERFSTTYTFMKAENKQQYIIGSQETRTRYHQVDFQHKIGEFWRINWLAEFSKNQVVTENFVNRNYAIEMLGLQPKLSYVLNNDNRFFLLYRNNYKENTFSNVEKLKQQRMGLEYLYTRTSKTQFNLGITIFFNNFTGNSNSPVGYQMLEGLRAGTNYTWAFLWSKKINSVVNLDFNYRGRKSVNSNTIHTGTINLKAIF